MQTQFKSLSPDHSVAELLAIKIKQEAEHIEDDKINDYFKCLFNWNFITLGIYPDGTVYSMYSETGFSSLAKVFGPKTLAEPDVSFREDDQELHSWRGK